MSREILKATMESAKSSRDGVFSGAEGDAAPISLLKTAYSKNITIEEWNQLAVDMDVVLRELSADSALLTTVYSMASQLCDDVDDYYAFKNNLVDKNDRELTITLDYAPDTQVDVEDMKAYVSEETYEKITNLYYETIKIKYNDGTPACVFHPVYYIHMGSCKCYLALFTTNIPSPSFEWYGVSLKYPIYTILKNGSDSSGKYVYMKASSPKDFNILLLEKSNFDDLYKTEPLTDGDIDAILI